MDREDFMDIVYEELEDDPDNNRANRIIWAADGYAERRVDDALQVIEELQPAQPEPFGTINHAGLEHPLSDEEIIPRLRQIQEQVGGSYAIDRAIELLTAQPEPCEDAVSREEVLNCLEWKYPDKLPRTKIMELPPVTPKQRTGEYVHVSGYSDQYKCTACGIDIVPMRVVKFCPECGAKILKMTSGKRIYYPWEGDAE